MNRISVLIVDDHPMVRQGLRTFLELQEDLSIVGEAGDGEKALALCQELRPDVILLDLAMPRMGGIDFLRELQRIEELGQSRIIVLTSFLDESQARQVLEFGVMGYLMKDVQPSQLTEAIRAVHRGEPSLHPEVTRYLMQQVTQPEKRPASVELLTQRELEVLRLLGKGYSNREIGETLVIAEKTVKTHVSSILAKLALPDRTQAALLAVREKLTSLD